MDRLGSEVWVSASFQLFALTTEGCPRWEGNCLSKRGKYQREYVRGDVQRKICPTLKKCIETKNNQELKPGTHWQQS